MKKINFEKMIGNREVFDSRKERLSLEDATSDYSKDACENPECLILLNKENSIKVENAIKNDFAYINYTKIVYNYIEGKNFGIFPKYDKTSIITLLKIIDYENNTDVWIHCREAFLKMVDFITDSKNDFWSDLNKGKPDLVKRLMDFSKSKVMRKPRGKSLKEECDAVYPSLASKACKYLSQYVLKKDNYYIYDSYVKKVLPYYCYYYLGKHIKIDENDYLKLFDEMQELQTRINEKNKSISKSELDHIMWYCYKSSGE